MEDLVESLARDNVTEVKVVLATVVMALAVYQLVLIAVGYKVIKVPFLGWGPATFSHRVLGDVIVVVTAVIAVACLSLYGFDDDGGTHAISGAALLVALALKIGAVRTGSSHSPVLPGPGGVIFVLFVITWWTSAADYLGED